MRRTPLTTTPRLQQVCVRPRPLAVNVALPAFAVERRAAAPCYRAVSMLLLHCRNWTDRRTTDSCIDSAPHTMRAVPITTDRVSGEGNAIGRVRPSVCFHSRLTLIFCTFVNHDDSSPGIESQGHRSMWSVRVSLRLAKMATRSVRPRSWIEGNLFYSFTSAAAVLLLPPFVCLSLSLFLWIACWRIFTILVEWLLNYGPKLSRSNFESEWETYFEYELVVNVATLRLLESMQKEAIYCAHLRLYWYNGVSK